MEVQADLALHWWQEVITFGSRKISVKSVLLDKAFLFAKIFMRQYSSLLVNNYRTEICFIIFRSEYKSILRASVVRVNEVMSEDLMRNSITLSVLVFVSLVFKVPLRPVELFTVLPLIFLAVEILICRMILRLSIRLLDVKVAVQRIEVIKCINTKWNKQ